MSRLLKLQFSLSCIFALSQVTSGTWTVSTWTSTTQSKETGTTVRKTLEFRLRNCKVKSRSKNIAIKNFSFSVCWQRPSSPSHRSRHRYRPHASSSSFDDVGSGVGVFGDPLCDSPAALVDSALNFMRAKTGDRVQFIIWTG